jgi:hypothetical protein
MPPRAAPASDHVRSETLSETKLNTGRLQPFSPGKVIRCGLEDIIVVVSAACITQMSGFRSSLPNDRNTHQAISEFSNPWLIGTTGKPERGM